LLSTETCKGIYACKYILIALGGVIEIILIVQEFNSKYYEKPEGKLPLGTWRPDCSWENNSTIFVKEIPMTFHLSPRANPGLLPQVRPLFLKTFNSFLNTLLDGTERFLLHSFSWFINVIAQRYMN
jgi:hypothetical protein